MKSPSLIMIYGIHYQTGSYINTQRTEEPAEQAPRLSNNKRSVIHCRRKVLRYAETQSPGIIGKTPGPVIIDEKCPRWSFRGAFANLMQPWLPVGRFHSESTIAPAQRVALNVFG